MSSMHRVIGVANSLLSHELGRTLSLAAEADRGEQVFDFTPQCSTGRVSGVYTIVGIAVSTGATRAGACEYKAPGEARSAPWPRTVSTTKTVPP